MSAVARVGEQNEWSREPARRASAFACGAFIGPNQCLPNMWAVLRGENPCETGRVLAAFMGNLAPAQMRGGPRSGRSSR